MEELIRFHAPPHLPPFAAEEVRCLCSGCWRQACFQQLLEPSPRDRWFGLCLLLHPCLCLTLGAGPRTSLPTVWGPRPGDDGALRRAGTAPSSRETLKPPACYSCDSCLPLRLRPVSKPVPEPAKGPAAQAGGARILHKHFHTCSREPGRPTCSAG